MSLDSILGNTFLVPDPVELSKDPAFSSVIGPFLRFRSIFENVFSISILLVSKAPLVVKVNEESLQYKVLDTFKGYTFYKYLIDSKMTMERQIVEYTVYLQSEQKTLHFNVPSKDENLRFAFYSCAGLSLGVDSNKLGGYSPLFQDLLQEHKSNPFHVIVGGGDQIYNDAVLDIPVLATWKKKSRKKQIKFAMTVDMTSRIDNFYFNNYSQHFMRDQIRTVLGSIPSINQADDHDIFNGFGSFTEEYTHSEVIQGILKCAKRFYYLFQLHSTPEQPDALIKHSNFFTQLGPNQALVAIDTRSERTITQVCSQETYELIFNELDNLQSTIKHVIVVVGIPLIFPSVKRSEHLGNLFNVNENDMSDLRDQWSAKGHRHEKLNFIVKCQDLAKKKSIRFTFLSGDSHCIFNSYRLWCW